MADPRFFHNHGPITLQALATLTGAAIDASDATRSFTDVAPLDKATATDISFLDNVKYVDSFAQSKAGACFVRPKYAPRAPHGMVLLVSDDPYYCYAQTARQLYPDMQFVPAISQNASIDPGATIGKGVRVDAGAVIGAGARIGDGCWIGANSVISDQVEIGAQCRIGASCTLSHAILGSRVMLHRGIHIGQDGFGFAMSKRGILKIPQLGRVVIGDDVEIGSGTCIDRGTGPDTAIGSGSKIDNLVQIGHNVQIGRQVIIAAQCGIAGSTRIEDGAILGGQVGLSGHVRIGAGARLAAQAGVMTDIPAGATYGGSPAVPVKDWHRQTLAMASMSKKKGKEE